VAGSRRGWTLLELLVSIGIIALLIALLIPAIGAARKAAGLSAIASHQRGVLDVLLQYTADHGDQFPYYGEAGTIHAELRDRHGNVVATGHWSHPYYWGFFLEVNGYDGWQSAITPAGPSAARGDAIDRNQAWTSLHILTNTAYATPQFWTAGGDRSPQQLRAMRVSDVLYPSEKGLLVMAATDRDDPAGDIAAPASRRWSVAFPDGHVETPRVSDLRPGLVDPPDFDGIPVLDTKDGLHGRDQ